MEDTTADSFRQSIDTAIVSALGMRDHLKLAMRVLMHYWNRLGLNKIGQQNTIAVRVTLVIVRFFRAIVEALTYMSCSPCGSTPPNLPRCMRAGHKAGQMCSFRWRAVV